MAIFKQIRVKEKDQIIIKQILSKFIQEEYLFKHFMF